MTKPIENEVPDKEELEGERLDQQIGEDFGPDKVIDEDDRDLADMTDQQLVGLYSNGHRTKELLAAMMPRGLLLPHPNPRYIRLSEKAQAIYKEVAQKLGWGMPIEHFDTRTKPRKKRPA